MLKEREREVNRFTTKTVRERSLLTLKEYEEYEIRDKSPFNILMIIMYILYVGPLTMSKNIMNLGY